MKFEDHLEAVEDARKAVELAQMELDSALGIRTAGIILGVLSVVSFGSIAAWNVTGMTGFNGAAIPIGVISFIGAIIALVNVFGRNTKTKDIADSYGYRTTNRTIYHEPKIVAARFNLAEAQKQLRIEEAMLSRVA